MRYFLLYSIVAIVFSACSFKTAPNEWQHKSVNAFNSYTKNFLSNNDSLAKNDLNRAISHAKSSSDLSPLARIYLGKCALNISVGIKDTCSEYNSISEFIKDDKLNAYYSFLTSTIAHEQIKSLPNSYQSFYLHVESSNFYEANNDILNIDKPTSKLLAASLIKNNINDKTIEKILKVASFYGYKKVVLFWLNEKISRTNNEEEKRRISKKIDILNSK